MKRKKEIDKEIKSEERDGVCVCMCVKTVKSQRSINRHLLTETDMRHLSSQTNTPSLSSS